jgi:hypothetical protein
MYDDQWQNVVQRTVHAETAKRCPEWKDARQERDAAVINGLNRDEARKDRLFQEPVDKRSGDWGQE